MSLLEKLLGVRDAEDDAEPLTLSVSRMGMWLRCPRQFMYRYIQGVIRPPGGFLIQGRVYHVSQAMNFMHRMEHGVDMEVDQLLDTCGDTWREEVSNAGEVQWEDVPGKMLGNIRTFLKLYLSEIAPSIGEIESVERFETIPVGSVEFRRVRDLTLKDSTIIDHKVTGRRPVPNPNDAQAILYSFPDERPFEYHVALRHKRLKVAVVPYADKDGNKTTISMAEKDWWIGTVEDIAKAISAGNFPPNFSGWHCTEKWCGYWTLCGRRKMFPV